MSTKTLMSGSAIGPALHRVILAASPLPVQQLGEVRALSPHLSEAEFLTTRHVEYLPEQRRIWDGTPDLQAAARRFAVQIYEPVRRLLGPLHVNSGYRCPGLNLAVGGHPQSRHMLGLAADVVPMEYEIDRAMTVLAGAVRAGAIPDVDQAIVECGSWIHLQAAPVGAIARRQVLTSDDGKTFAQYPPAGGGQAA